MTHEWTVTLSTDGEILGIHEGDTAKAGYSTVLDFDLGAEGGRGRYYIVVRPSEGSATVAELAKELGVTTGRVRQLAQRGRIEGACKIGPHWTFPRPVQIVPNQHRKRKLAKVAGA